VGPSTGFGQSTGNAVFGSQPAGSGSTIGSGFGGSTTFGTSAPAPSSNQGMFGAPPQAGPAGGAFNVNAPAPSGFNAGGFAQSNQSTAFSQQSQPGSFNVGPGGNQQGGGFTLGRQAPPTRRRIIRAKRPQSQR
jgi:hypothetical protein